MRKKQVYMEIYGCPMSKGDAEYIIGQLQQKGYALTEDKKKADLIVLVTCGVKKPTEDKIITRLINLSGLEKPIIVAGCLPRINLKVIREVFPGFAAVMDPNTIDKICYICEEVIQGKRNLVIFSENIPVREALPKVRLSKFTEIVQISHGCLGSCTYCAEKMVRRLYKSFPPEDIVKHVRRAIREGVKEILLTALDTGCYGLDIGENLVTLLKRIIMLRGKYRVRVGMMNPLYAYKMLDELLEVYQSERVYRFIHIPLQSGSNRVLEEMDRQYRAEDFIRVVRRLRDRYEDITIVTDVIIGFPTETERDFEDTLRVIEKTMPDKVNMSKFFARPGTEASKLDPLPPGIIKDRSTRLKRLVERTSLERNQALTGKTFDVLFHTVHGVESRGRLPNYKPIHVKECVEPGSFKLVEVIEAKNNYLLGQLKANRKLIRRLSP